MNLGEIERSFKYQGTITAAYTHEGLALLKAREEKEAKEQQQA